MNSPAPSAVPDRRGGDAAAGSAASGTSAGSGPNPLLHHASQWIELLRQHLLWWTIPAGAAFVLALAYALFATPTWRATQQIVARDEAVGSLKSLGRFESVDAMKTYWETVYEVVRSETVAEAALREAGPPANWSGTGEWPTPADVNSLRGTISLVAPNGAEFGRTEMVYLCVDANNADRAIALNRAVGNQLEKHLKLLRDARAQSVIVELQKKVQLDESELKRSTEALEAIDRKLGSDLGTLRPLLETGSGDNNLQSVLTQTRAELRQLRTKQAGLELQKKLLTEMAADPANLLATPSQLLDAHPALKRLKDGLVDSQLKAADLEGRFSANHPEVIAAKQAVAEVRRNMYAEVQLALRGIDADIKFNEALVAQLVKQEAETVGKLELVAKVRASYSNLVAEVKSRSQVLEDDRKRLADAQASRNAAAATSLLTRLDTPVAGDRPLGPGKTVIVGGGLIGGLAVGFGLVFLITSPQLQIYGRRWSDFLHGRRSTDPASERPSGEAAPTTGRGRRGDDKSVAQRPAKPATSESTVRRHTDLEPAPAPLPSTPPAPEASESDRRGGDRRQNDRRR